MEEWFQNEEDRQLGNQQKIVTTTYVQNNPGLDQGLDGRVGRYLYKEVLQREGCSEVVSTVEILVQEFESQKRKTTVFVITYIAIHQDLVGERSLWSYIHKQRINRRRISKQLIFIFSTNICLCICLPSVSETFYNIAR